MVAVALQENDDFIEELQEKIQRLEEDVAWYERELGLRDEYIQELEADLRSAR